MGSKKTVNGNTHPSALVSPEAHIGSNVAVGAFTVIEAGVVIGDNTSVREHAIIRKGTVIGEGCTIHPFVVIGEEPQHLGYKNEPTAVRIGNRVTLRESVTVHRGTSFGRQETSIDDGALIMAYSHVAHDCRVGKNVIIANAVQLAGHVDVDPFVTIGGHSAVAQFCRIGQYCYIGGGSVIRKDLPPYLLGKGNDFKVQGVNAIGLSRNGFSDITIKRLRTMYKIFFLQKRTVSSAIEKTMMEIGEGDDVRLFIDFVNSSKNGFHR